VFEDVDRSAYQGAIRPDFERLERALGEGAFDGVLVWKLDRLVRRPADFERFWSACEPVKAFLASVTEPIDSSTEIGLAIVRVLVTIAGLESSTMSLRIKAKLREKAERGDPGTGQRPFGHSATWDAVVEPEAALIREAAERFLRGETLRAVAESWWARGITGVNGGAWTSTQLRKTLRNPRIVGDRALHGEVTSRDCFPPIVDRLTFERLRVVMAQRAGPEARRPRAFLLSSFLVCSECGANLHGRSSMYPSYFCTRCSKVSISTRGVDQLITEALFERLAKRRRRRLPRPLQPAVLALRCHADALGRLNQEYFVARTISREEFLQVRAELGVVMASVRPEPELVAHGLPRTFKIINAETAWEALTLSQRRAVIGAEMDHAVVVPARRPSRFFDATRVAPRWHSR
jgi:DNA invertase Pin-like site-specific DNA recombinase